MKSRIVERTRQNGTKKYLIQTRVLFWWFDIDYEYDSLAEAKKKMCFHDGTRIVDRVVEESSCLEPDEKISALVARLHNLLKTRLKKESDPENFMLSLRPFVFHEFRHWLPFVVNEAAGKVYVLDSPVHGGKIVVMDGEFAMKALSLGEFP